MVTPISDQIAALQKEISELNSQLVPLQTQLTTLQNHKVPTVSFTAAQRSGVPLKWDFDASATVFTDGARAEQYHWDFTQSTFDSTAPGAPGYVYLKAGTYKVTLTVTDTMGAVNSVSKTIAVSGGTPTPPVNPTPTPSANVWANGAYDEGLPKSLVIAEYTDIYNTLSATDQKAENVLLKILSALPAYLSKKGWGKYAAIHFPAGFDGIIPGFGLGSDTYAHGFGSDSCVGLLGGVANGQMQARLTMKKNGMTAGQAAHVAALSVTGGNGSGYTTNPFVGLFMSGSTSGQAQYLAGIEFDGNDMQTVTDYRETGPANWGGIALYHPGAGSIVQNILLKGFGKTDSTSPPGEVGALSLTRDSKATVRRVELDGRLPGTTTRRSGGILFSASNTPTLSDSYLHDSYTSGLSFSFAGSILPANASTDVTTNNIRVENMANHSTGSGWRFAAINQEEPQGTFTHNKPNLGMDKTVEGLWDAAHISYSNQGMPAGNKAAQLIVNDPVISDNGAYKLNNGCLAIKSGATTKSVGLQNPIVNKNGKPLQMWIRTGPGAAPSNVTPDTHFVYVKQN